MLIKKKNKVIVYSRRKNNSLIKLLIPALVLIELIPVSLYIYFRYEMPFTLPYSFSSDIQSIFLSELVQIVIFTIVTMYILFSMIIIFRNKKTVFILDSKKVEGRGFNFNEIGAIVIWSKEDWYYDRVVQKFHYFLSLGETDIDDTILRYWCIGIIDKQTTMKIKKIVNELKFKPSSHRKLLLESEEAQIQYIEELDEKFTEEFSCSSEFLTSIKPIAERKSELPVWNAAEKIATLFDCPIVDKTGFVIDIREPCQFNMTLQERIQKGHVEAVSPGKPPEKISGKEKNKKLIIKWKYSFSPFVMPSLVISTILLVTGCVKIIESGSMLWLLAIIPGGIVFGFHLFFVRGQGRNKLQVTSENIIWSCSFFAQRAQKMKLSEIETIRSDGTFNKTMTFIGDKKNMVCFIEPEQALWAQLKIEYFLKMNTATH